MKGMDKMTETKNERMAEWKSLSTTSISDALGGLTNMDPGIKPVADHLRVAGRAYTVRLKAGDNALVLKGIREANPGDVLVIDGKGYLYTAVCGDFVAGMAQMAGLAGMVIDGAIRDIAGIRKLNFPVFSRGTTVAAGEKGGKGETGGPISCGGVPVRSGDLIVGDADGVVVIPQEMEGEVLKKAKEKQAKDEERERRVLVDRETVLNYLDEMLK
ncbi:putative regulator of ribonuclease activity [[Clostridium] ultunense Esp]|nr:putative regulator of ribonuclease activity [[Clostridium] ultunense Esp]